jgi:hypothetical protein
MSAKNMRIEGIAAKDANEFVRKNHYSGKVDTRSQLHFGVFWEGRLEGVMQFGPSIDKNKSVGLVRDTRWNAFIELNRLAFTDRLPKNAESRAISVAMRLIKKNAPHIEWCLSYADGTQCGDGTIYRAAGFHLLKITPNKSMWRMPDGDVICKIVLEPGFSPHGSQKNTVKSKYGKTGTETSTSFLKRIGAECLGGYQLKYIYFLNPQAKNRLTVPILDYSEIANQGATMYRGKRPDSVITNTSSFHDETGGVNPTSGLHTRPVESDHSQ